MDAEQFFREFDEEIEKMRIPSLEECAALARREEEMAAGTVKLTWVASKELEAVTGGHSRRNVAVACELRTYQATLDALAASGHALSSDDIKALREFPIMQIKRACPDASDADILELFNGRAEKHVGNKL